MNAVELIGYQDRDILKHALSSTLAKADHEKAIFDACFERYFSADEFKDSISTELKPAEIQPDTLDSPLTIMLLSGDQAGLSMAMRDAARDVDIGGIRFFTQKGLYAQRILKGMGLEDLDRDIKRLRSDTREASIEKATYLAEAKERLFSTVRDFIEQQFSLFSSADTEELM